MDKKVFKRLLNKNELVSIYFDDCDVIVYDIGYVIGVDDEYVLINHLKDTGEYDGLFLLRLEDIVKVNYQSEYEESIKALVTGKRPLYNLDFSDLITSVLKYSKDNKSIITIEFDFDDSLKGIVDSFDDEFLTLNLVSESGKFDGKTIVSIEDIYIIYMDTEWEKVK